MQGPGFKPRPPPKNEKSFLIMLLKYLGTA